MRLKVLLIIFGGSLLTVSLSHSLWGKYHRVERLEELQTEVSELEAEYQELEQQKQEVKSKEFLEKEARDKLQMVKPGEKIVILPENILGKADSWEFDSEELVDLGSNWRKWYQLFFD